ncbi:hypothetical protein ACFY40_29055 [Streptomyces sp. NPDC012950]|uniref:hypothetical protein n=1 Tax=Streptomyces sp. NPDC012950 TaxID=3364858 RepID=UPI0036774497
MINVADTAFICPGSDRPALTGINLDLKRGEVIALANARLADRIIETGTYDELHQHGSGSTYCEDAAVAGGVASRAASWALDSERPQPCPRHTNRPFINLLGPARTPAS